MEEIFQLGSRLIDDMFMNWVDSEAKLDDFFDYLNSLYPLIKWTMEKEGSLQSIQPF